jgi:hypothetical protein
LNTYNILDPQQLQQLQQQLQMGFGLIKLNKNDKDMLTKLIKLKLNKKGVDRARAKHSGAGLIKLNKTDKNILTKLIKLKLNKYK